MAEAGASTERPSLMATSQFAALEPSWARSRPREQLRGLLVLGALFNRRLYVHDTQLADSPHLVSDYEARHDTQLNLYTLLSELVEAGVIGVALRDGTYDAANDTMIGCRSLSDLVASWERRDPSSSWVIDPGSGPRRGMVEDLDELLDACGDQVQVYPYRDIKQDFMTQVRQAFHAPDPKLRSLVTRQGTEFARRYERIVAADWFSHSKVFSLIQEAGLPLDHPLAQTHGVFDEAAYARWHAARLLGCEWASSDVAYTESVLADPRPETQGADQARFQLADDLSHHALAVVECPGASLIGTLTAREILELRQSASELFAMQELFVTGEQDTRRALAKALANASAAYWQEISTHLSRTRPRMTYEPTKVAIFLREHLPSVSRVAERFVSMGLSAITKVAMAITPGVKEIDAADRASAAQHIKLDFVFFRESEMLRSLRQHVPLRGWVAADDRGTPAVDLSSAHAPAEVPSDYSRTRRSPPGLATQRIVYRPAF